MAQHKYTGQHRGKFAAVVGVNVAEECGAGRLQDFTVMIRSTEVEAQSAAIKALQAAQLMISPEQEEFVGSVSLGPCFMPEIWLHNVSQLELEQLGCLQLNALNCWASLNDSTYAERARAACGALGSCEKRPVPVEMGQQERL